MNIIVGVMITLILIGGVSFFIVNLYGGLGEAGDKLKDRLKEYVDTKGVDDVLVTEDPDEEGKFKWWVVTVKDNDEDELYVRVRVTNLEMGKTTFWATLEHTDLSKDTRDSVEKELENGGAYIFELDTVDASRWGCTYFGSDGDREAYVTLEKVDEGYLSDKNEIMARKKIDFSKADIDCE